MNILHICNDFSYTKVHHNLYKELDSLGYEQQIFNPLQKLENKGKNRISFKNPNSSIVYSSPLKSYHRILFRSKISFLTREILEKINIQNINLIHATTLFSDGALAYNLFRHYKIPYLVAVRNTDIEIFLRYRPDLIFLAQKILRNATNVIFISHSSYQAFKHHQLIKITNSHPKNIKITPNGINEYFLSRLKSIKKGKPRNLLFIGRFDKNKNVLRLISAFQALQKKKIDLKLTLVGGGGEYHEEVIELIKNEPSIRFIGYINGTEKLERIYSEHDIFTMVSLRETFGLVYLEALSQGLPILYSKSQGVSGEFPFKIGEEVNPMSEKEIISGIAKLIDNYNNYHLTKIDFDRYSWKNIAKTYSNIYKDAIV